MEIFPAESLEVLPFMPEPVSKWTHENDLMYFIACLLPYSEHFFDVRLQQFQTIAREFALNAQKMGPSESAKEMVEAIPNFQDDEIFGLAAKYAIAWFITTQSLLEESLFFSIPHMLEAYTELECSVFLASNLYYKQALQVLRNFLENAVLQLYFVDEPDKYTKWKENDYRVPSLRGKTGMLLELVKQEALPEKLAIIASDLYGELNGTIHGAEEHLIHRGVFTGQYSGQIFKYERFLQWSHYLARCADFAIRAQYLTISFWEKKRYQTGLICNICHNSALEIDESGRDDSTTTFRCQQCGNEMSFSTEWLADNGLI